MSVIKNGLLCLLFTTVLLACASKYSSPVINRDIEKRPVSHSQFHVVKPGETLYSIAWQYGLDHSEIASWNHIRSPYRILPKQKLRVKPPSKKKSYGGKQIILSDSGKKEKTVAMSMKYSSSTEQLLNTKKIKSWDWPAKGRLIRSFSAGTSGKKGIAIAGKRGQKIRAAAPGRVVYSGGGLLRYGKLVIVKHNKSFLSAYAHNEKLLVKEGEWVKINQSISTMGSSGTNRTMLHFEIRRNGKPVNPLRFLPKPGKK